MARRKGSSRRQRKLQSTRSKIVSNARIHFPSLGKKHPTHTLTPPPLSKPSAEAAKLGLDLSPETDPSVGLSETAVSDRKRAGLQNVPFVAKSKPVNQIVKDNLFTLFNTLNFILAGFVLLVAIREPKLLVNLTFMGVIFSNIAIGIIQELRAKRTVDRLRVLTDPKACVIRSGREQTIPVDKIVRDDILVLRAGNQIPVDGVFLQGEGFEVDESLLTGESDSVSKQPGEAILSGSFAVSGRALMRVIRISGDTYAAGIAREVKKSKKIRSQILFSINTIIKTLSWVILPIGLLLFSSKFFMHGKHPVDFSRMVVSTVAALVGMIPEGLMLMTSIAFAVGIVNLGKRKTLVQLLPSIETLARVDMLCLDKTGTITTGQMDFLGCTPIASATTDPDRILQDAQNDPFTHWMDYLTSDSTGEAKALAAAILAQTEENSTQKVLWKLVEGLDQTTLPQPTANLPFSSKRKFFATQFASKTWYAVGAPEFILDPNSPTYAAISPALNARTQQGQRVLLVARGESSQTKPDPLPEMTPLFLLSLGDQIRPDAAETFEYFREQGVGIRIISGDHPNTVSSVAQRAGVTGAEKHIDLSSVPDDANWDQLVDDYVVFGRVTPHRKRQLLHALQNQGHVVAMTGDGVNDVPALKDADCGVAMAAGSDAARSSADIVLLSNHLHGIIDAVYEGRRVINNIERVATLFLVKTIYSSLLAIFFILVPLTFPIYPIQITFISSLTIGIPAFVLALKPNRERVTGAFLQKVLYRCVPGGLACTLMVLLPTLVLRLTGRTAAEISAFCALSLVTGGLLILRRICLPWDRIKRILFVSILLLFTLEMIFLPSIFAMKPLLQLHMLPYLPLLLLYVPLLRSLDHFRGTDLAAKLKRRFHKYVQKMDEENPAQ